ncbi:MAG: hypothetical protein C4586_07435 [Anaerolineaceae bacterium]|nr:MAG: hypothetical protein C4586_07435 [Anaerolineaceae bacterium]
MLNIDLNYASEKFSIAVGAMASSTDSLHTRLAKAWIHNLSAILMNDVSNLPAEIQTKLSELSKKLYAGESNGAGPDIDSLVNALDEDQVRNAIEDIVNLHHSIIRKL